MLLLYRLGRDLFDPLSGAFAAIAMALSAPFVYYAKTANLEVPLLFWFLLSYLFFLRLDARGELRDYLGFTLSAVLAMGTKDQAFAFYILPLAAFALLRARQEGSFLRVLVDWRVGLAPRGHPVVSGAPQRGLQLSGLSRPFRRDSRPADSTACSRRLRPNSSAMVGQTLRHLGFALGLAPRGGRRLWSGAGPSSGSTPPDGPMEPPVRLLLLPVLHRPRTEHVAALFAAPRGVACDLRRSRLPRLWNRGVWTRALVGAALLYSLGGPCPSTLCSSRTPATMPSAGCGRNVSSSQVVGGMGPERPPPPAP